MTAKTYFTLHIPVTEAWLDTFSWFLVGILVGMLLLWVVQDMEKRRAVRAQHKVNSEAWVRYVKGMK